MAIQLDLTLDEVNGIMQALGQMPYAQVAPLVEKVRSQAAPQVQAQQPTEGSAVTDVPSA